MPYVTCFTRCYIGTIRLSIKILIPAYWLHTGNKMLIWHTVQVGTKIRRGVTGYAQSINPHWDGFFGTSKIQEGAASSGSHGGHISMSAESLAALLPQQGCGRQLPGEYSLHLYNFAVSGNWIHVLTSTLRKFDGDFWYFVAETKLNDLLTYFSHCDTVLLFSIRPNKSWRLITLIGRRLAFY